MRPSTPAYRVTVTDRCLLAKAVALTATSRLPPDSGSAAPTLTTYNATALLGLLADSLPAPSSPLALSLVKNFLSYDTPILNALYLHPSPTGTFNLLNRDTEETWAMLLWTPPSSVTTAVLRAYYALLILGSYWLLSSLSALLVRTLTTSGVAVVYPICEMLIS